MLCDCARVQPKECPIHPNTCDVRVSCGIMPTMFLRHYQIGKTVAWLLPFCFVACFVACLNNCSHGEDSTEIFAYHSTDVLSGLGVCEGCPIAALPITLAQRLSNSHAVMYAGRSLAEFSPGLSSTSPELITLPYRFLSTSDPPLERLCVIRI